MQGRLLLPDARFRSPTAVAGKADMRDENVFSALVLQHGGAGQTRCFTVPFGQSIPTLAGSSINAPAQSHQKTYTELTTNLAKAGELGSSLGDAAIRAIGITIEQAGFQPFVAGGWAASNTLGIRIFGATQFEVADILSKTFFQLKIAGKKQIEGASWMFPAPGGVYGSVGTATTGNNVSNTASMASNGLPGMPRKLKIPILVARTDTVEGVFGVAGSSSLAFSNTAADGQPVLTWFTLHTVLKGDVR